jgi:hypothetical protein
MNRRVLTAAFLAPLALGVLMQPSSAAAPVSPPGMSQKGVSQKGMLQTAPLVLVQDRDDRGFRERYARMGPEQRQRYDGLQYEIEQLRQRQQREMREGDRREGRAIEERIEQLRGEQARLLGGEDRRAREWGERYARLDPQRRQRFDGIQYEIEQLQRREQREAREGDRPEVREMRARIEQLRDEQARMLGLN